MRGRWLWAAGDIPAGDLANHGVWVVGVGVLEGGEDGGVRILITILRIAGPTAPLPSPKSSLASTNAQNCVASALPNIASAATNTPPRTINAIWPRSA